MFKKIKYFDLLSLTCLCFLGVIIYSNALHSPFQFDDSYSITNNPGIKNVYDLKAVGSYLPTRFITYLTIALNYHFGKFDVLGYHLFNLIIHLCAAIMVWCLTILTLNTPALKDDIISSHSSIIAFFTGLVFVSHPIQTQGVTYICQRAASLAALFYVLSIVFYAKARLIQQDNKKENTRRVFYHSLSLSAAVVAMFTKEIVITLPFMILLYEYYFLKENKGMNWKYVTPFLCVILIIPATMAITKSVNFAEMRLAIETKSGISPWEYLLTQTRVICTYLRLLFVPINQNVDYDYHISKSLFEPAVLSSLALIILIMAAAIRAFSKYRLVSFGVFFFFLTLVPESSLIPFKDVIFEHRLYLPMVGFSMFLASGVYYIFGNKNIKATIIILSVLIITYSFLAYNRNSVWRDEVALWNDTVCRSPQKMRPYNNRGNAFRDRGDFNLAILDYDKAIELDPGCPGSYYNRGIAYKGKGDLTHAMIDYNRAIELCPNFAEAYCNRGNIYQSQGNMARAILDYNEAIKLKSLFAKAYNNRAAAYQILGSLDQAILDYSKAIEIDPEYADAYNNRGFTYFLKKDYGRSWEDVHRAERLGCKVIAPFFSELKRASGREK